MNKTLIIIALLLSLPIIAQNIIEDIDWNHDTLSYEMLKEKVKNHQQQARSFISIGESHLQSQTALPINLELAHDFVSEESSFIICLESLSHLEAHPEFKSLSQLAKKTIISQNNGPALTDFVECHKNNNKRFQKIYYSGFFHQYPFARAYPKQFAESAVITQKGNNLWEQKPTGGLFITQVEMIYLEYILSRDLFINAQNVEDLKRRFYKSESAIMTLKNKMDIVLESSSAYQEKRAVIVTPKHYPVTVQSVMPKETYIMITELNYRSQESGLHFMEKFTKLPANLASRILSLPQNQKYFISSLNTYNSEDELSRKVGYGTLSESFEFGSYYLEMKHKGQSLLLVSEPSQKDFYIYLLNKMEDKTIATLISNDELFKKLD